VTSLLKCIQFEYKSQAILLDILSINGHYKKET
jgi:hypothetical protein